jgi:peptidoglycan biosynthesis protein MviN/MurJ (putative lipid II flippase)
VNREIAASGGASIAVLSALNTLVSFVVPWLVVTELGMGGESDALFASSVVPQLMVNVICASLPYVLVPLLVQSAPASFFVLVSTYCLSVSGGLAVLAAIVGLASPVWVEWIFPGFSQENQVVASSLIAIQCIGIAFTGVASVLSAAYNSRRKFVYPVWCAFASSAIAAVGFLLSFERFGIFAAAWAMTLRPIIFTVLQFPIAIPPKWPDFSHHDFLAGLRRLWPISAGSSYYKTDQLVDRFLASLAVPGALSTLHLAQQLYGAANQIVVASIANPAMPKFVGLALGSKETYWKFVRVVMIRVSLIGAVFYAVICIFGKPILGSVFGGGNFGADDADQLWLMLLALGMAWMAGLVGQVISNAFYATGDTRTPTVIGAIGFTLGIGIKVIGFFLLGVVGIALATGIYSIGNAIAMIVVQRNRLR